MDNKTYLLISGAIFGLVAVGHILRVMFNWSFCDGRLGCANIGVVGRSLCCSRHVCVGNKPGYKGITFALGSGSAIEKPARVAWQDCTFSNCDSWPRKRLFEKFS